VLAIDCANVLRSKQGDGFERHGTIILEIKSRREAFSKVEFIHEGRHANFDAHLLARSSVSISFGRHVWFLSP